MDVEHLGQVFTPASIVLQMLDLRKNKGTVLDPSVGCGAFLSQLEIDAVGIEIDNSLSSNNEKRIVHCDFFEYTARNKFHTIIGNPPYVRYQDILPTTRRLLSHKLFDRRSNLYLFFIEKCINLLEEGGELIMITPRDFLKATNSQKLNHIFYKNGSFTHYFELGDERVFSNYAPNCAIWRWEKCRKERIMVTGGKFCYNMGQIWFGNQAKSSQTISDHFDVKVGAVSGADHIFTNDSKEHTEFVCSKTCKNGVTKRMIYNRKHESLNRHKSALMNRLIRKFDESNWWEWGRRYHKREGERIYVNCKTRNPQPFFHSEVNAYDGSVLALFPKEDIDMEYVLKKLNEISWAQFGFVCGGRLLFSQRSLSNAPFA